MLFDSIKKKLSKDKPIDITRILTPMTVETIITILEEEMENIISTYSDITGNEELPLSDKGNIDIAIDKVNRIARLSEYAGICIHVLRTFKEYGNTVLGEKPEDVTVVINLSLDQWNYVEKVLASKQEQVAREARASMNHIVNSYALSDHKKNATVLESVCDKVIILNYIISSITNIKR